MSLRVKIQTTMRRSDLAIRACQRRFRDVRVQNNKIFGKLQQGSWGRWFEIDLHNFNLGCDSDFRQEVERAVQEAYAAEEIIEQAEMMDFSITESRNELGELVLVVEG